MLSLQHGAGDSLALTPATSHAQLLVFSLIYGLGYGGGFTLVQASPAKLFGDCKSFAALMSFIVVWQYAGAFAGVAVSAALHDCTGSYTLPFSLFPLCSLMVAIHYLRARTLSDEQKSDSKVPPRAAQP